MNNNLCLNGVWDVDFLSVDPYFSDVEPFIDPHSDSTVQCPVPAYWEDLSSLFYSTTLGSKMRVNPDYSVQRYPMTGYAPDMMLPNLEGCLVYQRTFHQDEIVENDAELWIGGAQNTVSAWLNGMYLGRHEGYSAPFSFSAPAGCLHKGDNRITLAVSNNRLTGYMGRPVSGVTSRAACSCTGGIYGDIELCSLKEGLRALWVIVSEDCSRFTVYTNGGEQSEKQVELYDGEKRIASFMIPAGQTSCTADASDLQCWCPDFPKLYKVTVTVGQRTLSQRFGIRRLTVKGTKLYLNGQPFFFRGICECGYQAVTVHPTSDKRYYRHAILRLKELGFNSIRFHTWIPPVQYMEAADELGMILEVESPNNTSFREWQEIVRFCREHTSVNLYSTGNELQIDHDYEEHLEKCADLVHSETDALFSPMSAMRGIEYSFIDDITVDVPFQHNPERMKRVGQYSDIYNSYSQGLTSYCSTSGNHEILDRQNSIYGKPLLSHEIGIHGTYIDLSLEERYKDTRIGQTEFMSSVRQHLTEKGLSEKANLYYRNSVAWQKILRKHCFETVRRSETFAGYDFLGDIDTHWHTFGYCVGMMNEFYELKPGETADNVRRYNGDTVLLADLPAGTNYSAGEEMEIPILVSHYGRVLPSALLLIQLTDGTRVYYRLEIRTGEIPQGAITEMIRAKFRMPECRTPVKLTLSASLHGGDTDCDNRWDLYLFPDNSVLSQKLSDEKNIKVFYECNSEMLWKELTDGQNVIVFGPGPFISNPVSWQLSVAGRTVGHLATVVEDHPLLGEFPHDGFCGRQFESMLNNSCSVVMDLPDFPHRPIVDIASSYKNAHKEGMMFEFNVSKGKLFVCTLNLDTEDPGALWLKNIIIDYVSSYNFAPEQTLTKEQFAILCEIPPIIVEDNQNKAMNRNDITMR